MQKFRDFARCWRVCVRIHVYTGLSADVVIGLLIAYVPTADTRTRTHVVPL